MKQPNILIVMPDQMVADVMRADHPCVTPNMDRFAAEGIRFDQTYCVTAHCCPSRASFFTGEYPSRNGIWNNVSNVCAISRSLNPGVPTFGEILRGADYRLGFSGKWHASDTEGPADFGWREYGVGGQKGHWTKDGEIVGFEKQLKNPPPPVTTPGRLERSGWGDYKLYETYESGNRDRSSRDRQIFSDGKQALKDLSGREGPWCLFVSCNAPHDPYHAPKQYVDLYKDVDIPLPESFADDMKDKPRIYERMRRQYWDQLDDDETKECIKHYWAMCSMVDDWFGGLLADLDATGQADDTLVLFTSDHGDYTGAHGLWCKGVPSFREAYHVPAVVRWPAGITDPGRTVNALVSLTDFMPTFVELATGRKPDVYGDSLLPFFKGDTPADWRDALHVQMNGTELYYTQRIVSTHKWKYVFNGFDFDEFYDLENDPHEMVNLSNPDLYDQSPKRKDGERVPWPRMTDELEAVRKELVSKMWKFAYEQGDGFLFTPYLTNAQVPYGPLVGMEMK